jgi:PPE-repeat protein
MLIYANKALSSGHSMVKNDPHSPIVGMESEESMTWNAEIRRSLNYLIQTLYAFLIISLLTIAQNLQKSEIYSQNLNFVSKCNLGSWTTTGVNFEIPHLTSCWVLIIVGYLCKYKNAKMQTIFTNFGYPKEGPSGT